MKEIIREGESTFELEGNKYYLTKVDDSITSVEEDVQSNPDLKRKLLKAKQDIQDGKTYSSEEVLEMIVHGKLY